MHDVHVYVYIYIYMYVPVYVCACFSCLRVYADLFIYAAACFLEPRAALAPSFFIMARSPRPDVLH